MTITLYDLAGADPAVRFSPYCWRTRFSLQHKGLSFEAKPWRFTEKDRLPDVAQGRVPAVVDHDRGGKAVADSWQIALYLDEAYPERPALMANEASRAGARLVASWAEGAVGAAGFPLILPNLFANIAGKDQAYFRDSREKRFGKTLEQIAVAPEAGVAAFNKALLPAELALAQAPFLSGSSPAYADYALAGTVMWIWVTAPVAPLDPNTNVGRWFDRMLDLNGGEGRKAPVMR